MESVRVQSALETLLDSFSSLLEAFEPNQGQGQVSRGKWIVGVEAQCRPVSFRGLLKLSVNHQRVSVEMISVRVLRIGLGQQRTGFNALVELSGDMSKVGRRDLQPLSL